MYLKSLEMQGFKSFPDKTKLTFEGGTTVIVGPNGSGKSNISDAMRWVLGEISAKSIRGSKMEDIIFAGADSRRQMGFAEVSITFDNTDETAKLDSPYDEVTVTRRYYRAGESEYFINRKPVRLKDIYELFMNTGVGRDGYSIIGQGKIAEMISKKSDERRSVFEDAAGIARFRHKKTETERKLAQTEDNMTRINDVFVEVESQVGPLEKEAEKARRAIELLDRKKKADVQLWLYDTEKLRTDIEAADEAYRRASFDLQNAEDSIAELERQNARLFEESQSTKMSSEQIYRQIREQTEANHKLDSDYKVAETNLEHTRELLAAARASIETAQRSIENESLGKEARLARVRELEAKLEEAKAAYEKLAQDQKTAESEARELELDIAAALEDIRRIEAEENDLRVRVSVLENANAGDSDKTGSMLRDLENYEKTSRELTEQCAQVQKSIDSYEESASSVESEMSAHAAEAEKLEAAIEGIDRDLSTKKFRRDSIIQRIENFRVMEEQFEGYNSSVRFVMKQYAEGKITDAGGVRCDKIYGPLSRVISVDDRFITAVETALGANLQHIVVADESVAKAAMYCLKQAQAGRATFFPLSSMKPSTLTEELRAAAGYEGYIGVADTLVKCEDKFRGVVSNLLGRTVVFDNIDNATKMARAQRYRVRVVTLDGQQINAGGSFTGGSTKTRGGILSRVGEIKNLETELEAIKRQIEQDEKSRAKQAKALEEAEQGRNAGEDKLRIINMLKNSELNRLGQLEAKLEANNTLLTKLQSDLGTLGETRARNEDDIKRLTAEIGRLVESREEIALYRAERDTERNEKLSLRDELGQKLTESYIDINSIGKDIETQQMLVDGSEATIERYRADMASSRERIAELEAQIETITEQRAQNRERFAEYDEQLKRLSEQRAALEEDSMEFERRLNELNVKIRARMNEKELISREYTKQENKLENLRETQEKLANKLMEEHGLTRNEAIALGYPALDPESRREAQQIQTECRNKLRGIGNVDLDAVEKYKEVKARYDYMSAQIKDLTEAKSDLENILSRIDREMKTTFMEAFNKINENFNRVFCELFGGGSAEISLTDPEDVLGSGIEIKAAPPGKIIKSLMQLSGGEQSFVAIALFFATIQVNPTPFCILDEIEAALDEVNVARFAEYIKRYTDGTQFVVITHRRGTMEAANRLYGVTMPEHGISKVLELDVGEISKKKGDSWDEIF
ncbi:MAG: chromosome segregation protein SMC [Clostridia bacterium]|nr:chromosome segregation protein SMC [Clostridia bacterium]